MTTLLLRTLAIGLLISVAGAQSVHAQAPAPSAQMPSESPRVLPMRIQVVIARYQGDKRVSSLPYTMSVNAAAGGHAQIRMGADVPISTEAADDGKVATAKVNYDQIGTYIDCRVRPTDDKRYIVELIISDKSVYADGEGPQVARPRGNPTFRSFRATNTIILRDGQSTEFAAAGDRVTGEVVRVEVMLQSVK